MSSTSTSLYKRILFRIITAFFILYCLIWLVSSPIIKHLAKKPLADIGLTLSDDTSIRFNPFLTRISVSDLALTKKQETVFTTDHLVLQLALHKVPFDIIELEEFSINKVNIKIEKRDNDLIVAGVNLTSKASESKPEIEETKEPTVTNDKPKPLPYEIRLEELSLLDAVIDVTFEGAPHTFDIKTLLINNIIASQTHQSATLQLTSLLDNAAINLSSELHLENNQGSIKNKIKVSDYLLTNIKHFIEPLESLVGTLSISSNPTISLTKNKLSIAINNTELTTNGTQANTKKQSLHLENLTYKMEDFTVSFTENKIQEIAGTSQLSLNSLLVETIPSDASQYNKAQKILSFDQLNVGNIIPKLTTTSNKNATPLPVIGIDSVELNKLLFSQNTLIALPPLATINNINISNIEASAEALTIDTINVDTIASHVILNKDKALANLVEITTSEPETQTPIEEQNSVDSNNTSVNQAFQINLNAFNVINQNQINFIDNSVDPAYKRTFMIDKFTMGSLSNTNENKELNTPIELIGRSNEYANFTFNGFIKPFASQKQYHVKGDLNELSLPAVSTYMKDALELELTSGQLNTKLDVTLIDDNIDGDINISINGLETSAVNNHETTNIKGQVAIPFNVALDMLKDGNGNLVLDVPLSGKTSDPSFGISSFIALITKKAAISATEDYLMTTFVPYANIVSVAMSAGEFILKVRFEDLPYQPKQIKPDAKQEQYIAQFIALMREKEDTRVKICAVSTPADIGMPSQQKLSPENIKALEKLGNDREKAFKARAVKQKIESSRILFCTPQIDNSEDANPRIEISV